jgi:hypothetical protein
MLLHSCWLGHVFITGCSGHTWRNRGEETERGRLVGATIELWCKEGLGVSGSAEYYRRVVTCGYTIHMHVYLQRH